jgi:hypothetical protein
MLQEEFGCSKREALEKALYRARRKHQLKINFDDIPLRPEIDSDDVHLREEIDSDDIPF